jgi:hypothetical protein
LVHTRKPENIDNLLSGRIEVLSGISLLSTAASNSNSQFRNFSGRKACKQRFASVLS